MLELSLVPLGRFPRYLAGGSLTTSEEVPLLPRRSFPLSVYLAFFQFFLWGLGCAFLEGVR